MVALQVNIILLLEPLLAHALSVLPSAAIIALTIYVVNARLASFLTLLLIPEPVPVLQVNTIILSLAAVWFVLSRVVLHALLMSAVHVDLRSF